MSSKDDILRETLRITAQVIVELCQTGTLKQATDHPLSRNQFYILKILAISGEHLSSELAVILDISAAAVTKNIDRLESLGLVSRHNRPSDRRSTAVRVTTDGRQLVQSFDRITMTKQQAVMDQFSEEEKDHLLDMLRRVVRCMISGQQNVDLICLQCGGACGDECTLMGRKGICRMPTDDAAVVAQPIENRE